MVVRVLGHIRFRKTHTHSAPGLFDSPSNRFPYPSLYSFCGSSLTVELTLCLRLSSPHSTSPLQFLRADSMLQRTSRGALNGLSKSRCFSSSSPAAAISPYRRAGQAANAKTTTQPSKRPQSTATTATATTTQERPIPSPAFNRDDSRLRNVHPLRPYKPQEMDHSFVGMTGGEIFHDMMLRHGVKHICTIQNFSRYLV